MYILNEFLNGLSENCALLRCQWAEVWLGKCCNFGGAFGLLALAAISLVW